LARKIGSPNAKVHPAKACPGRRRRTREPSQRSAAPGMFAFADRDHVTEVVTAAGWAPPRFEKRDMGLDIAAGRGLGRRWGRLWFSQPKSAP
jgi:hypothetical protein